MFLGHGVLLSSGWGPYVGVCEDEEGAAAEVAEGVAVCAFVVLYDDCCVSVYAHGSVLVGHDLENGGDELVLMAFLGCCLRRRMVLRRLMMRGITSVPTSPPLATTPRKLTTENYRSHATPLTPSSPSAKSS